MYVVDDCYYENVKGKCFPNDGSWAGAAYPGPSQWMTIYRGPHYKDVAVQMHEIGHNWGLAHSAGLDGVVYSDHTGMSILKL